MYYSMPHVAAATGRKLPCQFPETTEWTPSSKACDGKDGKFEFEGSQWATATWSSLNFQATDKHYAAYRIVSSGTMSGAKAVLEARIDPDCAGKHTVYRSEIAGDGNASFAECAAPSNFEIAAADGSGAPPAAAKNETLAARKAPPMANCEGAVARFVKLAKTDPDFPKSALANVTSPAAQADMIEKCKAVHKPEELECMMAAESFGALTKCAP